MSDKEIHTDIDTSPKSSDTQERRTQKTVLFINEVVKQIRSLKKHYPNMDIHVDTHGGIRTDQEALNSILSLLQMEGITIPEKNIHSIEYSRPRAVFTSASEIFKIMNFVSGIHECIYYGQTASLKQAIAPEKSHSDTALKSSNSDEQEVLANMQTIAEGIQLCDVTKFETGLKNLSDSLPKLGKQNNSLQNVGYLTMFQDLIRDSYGHSLLNNKDRRVIDEIRWCTEKGFIQQALTLVESKMPAVFLKNGFLISEKQKEEKNGQKAVTAFSIFNSKSKDPVLSDDFLSYITRKNSPKKGWESAENYIVQAVGYTKRPSKKVPFVPLKERTNYLALEAYNSNPVISVLNTKDNTFPVRKYYIAENPKSYRKINILLRLHMQLKDERNKTNHAGNDSNRHSIAVICHALESYVQIYEAIEKDLKA